MFHCSIVLYDVFLIIFIISFYNVSCLKFRKNGSIRAWLLDSNSADAVPTELQSPSSNFLLHFPSVIFNINVGPPECCPHMLWQNWLPQRLVTGASPEPHQSLLQGTSSAGFHFVVNPFNVWIRVINDQQLKVWTIPIGSWKEMTSRKKRENVCFSRLFCACWGDPFKIFPCELTEIFFSPGNVFLTG